MSFHPEMQCERCKGPNVLSWHAPSPLWNAVMGTIAAAGGTCYSVLCPPCFAYLAESTVLNDDAIWCFKPHRVSMSAFPDRSGRIWDEENCLWVLPTEDDKHWNPQR